MCLLWHTYHLCKKSIEATLAAAERGAEIVLWPELAGSGFFEDVDALVEQSQSIAREEGIYLAFPATSFFADENRKGENILTLLIPMVT